ncbi:MAG: hypothetical protein WB609_07500 [Candidatus Cybelea sp.]
MKNVTGPKLNPMLSLFLKSTAVVAIAIVASILLWNLLKIVVIAAVLAAIGVGVFYIYSFIRRRSKLPVIR